MRRLAVFLTAGLLMGPALAQAAGPHGAVRALNLARQTAVQLNGGLGRYHPAACMFQSADADNPCLIARTAKGYTFRFQGGSPGWQTLGQPPTLETEIQVAPDGRSVKRLIYNGAIR